jgi:hypothetical protein
MYCFNYPILLLVTAINLYKQRVYLTYKRFLRGEGKLYFMETRTFKKNLSASEVVSVWVNVRHCFPSYFSLTYSILLRCF